MLQGMKLTMFKLSGYKYRIAHFMNENSFFEDYNYELHEDIIVKKDIPRKYRKPEAKRNEFLLKNNIEHVFYDYDNINPKLICSDEEYKKIKDNWIKDKPLIDEYFNQMQLNDKDYIINDEGQLEIKTHTEDYTGDLIDKETSHITVISPEWYYKNDNREPYMKIGQQPDKPVLQGIFGELNSTSIAIIMGVLLLIVLVVGAIIILKVPIGSIFGSGGV
jgi:hypothetical protein